MPGRGHGRVAGGFRPGRRFVPRGYLKALGPRGAKRGAMDTRLLLLFATLLACQAARHAQALKCRTEDDDQDEFREVARHCMSNMSNWDRPSDERGGRDWRRPGRGGGGSGGGSGGGGGGNGSGNGGGGGSGGGGGGGGSSQDSHYGGFGYGNRDNSRYQPQKNRNNGNNNNNNNNSNRNNQSHQWNRNGNNNRNDKNDKNNKDSSESSLENSDLEHIEPCIVHCIFRQMQMLDEDSFPDRTGVTNIMMRNVQDSRVKDFVEQAVDECFEIIESDTISNKCESAKNLAMCLEEKGRQNCEDWDDPPDTNKQKGNKNSNSRNQQRDSTGYM
ncbi:hypothetical protein R5R35_004541 [Gryllus longicercus]|uniref:Odorant binding protein n=1 Tax=Gryllus longicercus TaxID=2509291 RepID=A0AAN9VUY0_9ORTH